VATVHIVTDSAADLPGELCASLGITVVPLEVRLGTLDPEALRGASGERFWELEGETGALAETAAPSPGAFAEAFRAAHDAGADGVCCVTISSALSATYQAAVAGAAEVASEIPVEVVDSRFATMGEGLLVLEAHERAAAGDLLTDVAAATTAAIARTSTFGTLENLDALRRGGRIGAAQALLGSMLSIKPVIEVRDGVVEPESKQRTRGRSLAYLADKLRSAGPLRRVGIVHAAATDIDSFLALVTDIHPTAETVITYIGPVIGAHTGRGTVGVCLQRES
jgi:DegV family protein with EDD domain